MPPSSEASKDETVEGRIAAVAHLSAARALIDCAAEALEEHGVMFVPERASTIQARLRGTRAALDLLADEIMEPCEIADVLRTIEEVIEQGGFGVAYEDRGDGTRLVFHGALRLTTRGRAGIVRALMDARQVAKDDETDPGDPVDDYDAIGRPRDEGARA